MKLNSRLAAVLVPFLALPMGCWSQRLNAPPRHPSLLDAPPTDLPLPIPERAEQVQCELSLPPPQSDALVHGPAYVLTKGSGLLAITATGVHPVLPSISRFTNLTAVGPDFELWINESDGLHIVGLDQRVRQLPGMDRDYYRKSLRVRTATDVWTVAHDFDWRVEHFDGERWQIAGVEDDFQGRVEHDKRWRFVDFELTNDAVWIASTGGLFRSTEPGRWELIDELQSSPSWLGRYRGQLVARDTRGLFVREDEAWRALDLQLDDRELIIGDRGIIARAAPNTVVELHSMLGTGCSASSASLPGSQIEELTFDASGRVWARTDRGLAVVEPDGRIAAEWVHGSLPGLTSAPNAVVVIGAGPEQLPPAEPVHTRPVFGIVVDTERERIADATIELCSVAPRDGSPCPAASVLGRASSDVHGRFQMTGVLPGDYWLVIELAPNTEACAGKTLARRGFNLESNCPELDEPCSIGRLYACYESRVTCTPPLPMIP